MLEFRTQDASVHFFFLPENSQKYAWEKKKVKYPHAFVSLLVKARGECWAEGASWISAASLAALPPSYIHIYIIFFFFWFFRKKTLCQNQWLLAWLPVGDPGCLTGNCSNPFLLHCFENYGQSSPIVCQVLKAITVKVFRSRQPAKLALFNLFISISQWNFSV